MILLMKNFFSSLVCVLVMVRKKLRECWLTSNRRIKRRHDKEQQWWFQKGILLWQCCCWLETATCVVYPNVGCLPVWNEGMLVSLHCTCSCLKHYFFQLNFSSSFILSPSQKLKETTLPVDLALTILCCCPVRVLLLLLLCVVCEYFYIYEKCSSFSADVHSCKER